MTSHTRPKHQIVAGIRCKACWTNLDARRGRVRCINPKCSRAGQWVATEKRAA